MVSNKPNLYVTGIELLKFAKTAQNALYNKIDVSNDFFYVFQNVQK